MQVPLTWPNRITLMRLAGIPVFVMLLLRIQDEGPVYQWLALVLFMLLGLADMVDGWLARRLGQQTRLGTVLDPLADKLLLTIACILLAFPDVIRPPIPKWLAVAVVSRDLFLIIGSVVLYLLVGRLYIRPTLLGRTCTVAVTVTVLAALVTGLLPTEGAQRWGHGVLLVLAHGAAALTVASGVQYGWHGRAQLGAAAHEPADADGR